MIKIDGKLLPIKAHYFFFMAAMGPILPQISVYGKQLGISPDIMGYITSILPILYVLAKPAMGYLADYFVHFRKCIFVSVIVIMTLCYAGFYFVPIQPPHLIDLNSNFSLVGSISDLKECNVITKSTLCTTTRKLTCNDGTITFNIYVNRITNENVFNLTENEQIPNNFFDVCLQLNSLNSDLYDNSTEEIKCMPAQSELPDCLYNTWTFWSFVILMCLGTIGFNVTNCFSDAICFDVLGESQEMKYGAQRVWGTIGFGLTAFLAGIAVDLSTDDAIKSFTPALIIMFIFSGLDLLSVTKLKFPKFTTDSLYRDVTNLLKQRSIAIFLVFATIAGIIDSFIIFFMFWHLEEVAELTGYTHQIKLIEGCVIAAECLCGEIPIFLYSGKILKKIGYVHCLSLCFCTYAIRLALISAIPNPWWLVPIELVMQGCTYALCYTCIVAYASAIAPPGTSATVQGLVAGMDDGLGFAIGSLIGGLTYKKFGGRRSFQMFSIMALITCIAHIFIRPASKHETNISGKSYALPPEQILNNLELVEEQHQIPKKTSL